VAFAAAVVWFAIAAVTRQWHDVRAAAVAIHPRWSLIAASCAVVLLTYALLIEVWRTVLRSWDARLPFGAAAGIWLISNLGRYVPGKVWQLGSMAIMARDHGVSGVAAAGSALVVTLLNTVAGFVVVALTGMRLFEVNAPLITLALLLGAAVVFMPWVLPRLGFLAARVTGRHVQIPRMAGRALWVVLAACAAGWVMYGVAFRLFAVGVLGHAGGAVGVYVAVFTASYLAGFLALFAPGGLVVREALMAGALANVGMGAGPAIVLVVASRLWLTILEIVPALCFLAHRAQRRGS
jgi:glycosyltransferase 2 family protein